MQFKDRISQYPNRRKITKYDEYGAPEPFFYADIERDDAEEGVTEPGTLLNADTFNKGNWRNDKSLEFAALKSGDQTPPAITAATQLYTDAQGETWLVPPAGSGKSSFPINQGITDPTPIAGSPNPVQSGGVVSAIKEEAYNKVYTTSSYAISGGWQYEITDPTLPETVDRIYVKFNSAFVTGPAGCWLNINGDNKRLAVLAPDGQGIYNTTMQSSMPITEPYEVVSRWGYFVPMETRFWTASRPSNGVISVGFGGTGTSMRDNYSGAPPYAFSVLVGSKSNTSTSAIDFNIPIEKWDLSTDFYTIPVSGVVQDYVDKSKNVLLFGGSSINPVLAKPVLVKDVLYIEALFTRTGALTNAPVKGFVIANNVLSGSVMCNGPLQLFDSSNTLMGVGQFGVRYTTGNLFSYDTSVMFINTAGIVSTAFESMVPITLTFTKVIRIGGSI